MADNIFSVAGWKFHIGTELAPKKEDFLAADFDSVTYQEVDGWETMGAFGDAAQTIVTSLINRGRDLKQKGTYNAGTMENTFVTILGVTPDAGQEAMRAAMASRSNFAFKVTAPDAPQGGTPTTFEFVGLVVAEPLQGGGANVVQKNSFTIEINSNVVKTAASAS